MQRSGQRIFVKVTRETLPQAKDRYPFLYLEHGRLAIDDSSVKWIDKTGSVIRLSSEQIYPQRKRQKLPSPSFLSFLLFSVVLFKFLF